MSVFTPLARAVAAARGRPRSVASVGLVSVSVLSLLVAMLLADGFRATSYDLQDSSVWVTSSQKSSVGRINTQIARQDERLRLEQDTSRTGDLDIVQDGRNVMVVHSALGRVLPVDVVGVGLEGELPIPAGAEVSMAGGTVAVALGGDVWVSPADAFAGVVAGTDDEGGAEPTLELGPGGLAVVGTSGAVAGWAPAEGGGSLLVSDAAGTDEPAESPVRGAVSGSAQLTMVGSDPVLLDADAGRLHLVEGPPVELPPGEWSLQLPGDDPSQVVLASPEGLLSVATEGGGIDWLPESRDVGGDAARPVRVGGCTYGGWSGPASMYVLCDGHEPVAASLGDLPGTRSPNAATATGEVRFRVNQTRVALNFVDTGAAFLLEQSRQLRQADDWGSETPSTTSTTVDPDDSAVIELKEEQEPPKPTDDEFGARPGRQTLLGVLDNDTDANGDPLTVEALEPAEFEGGTTVSIVQGAQAVQITPGPDTAGETVTFRYTVSDGQDTATANVRVTIRHPEENAAPELKLDPSGQERQPSLEVRLGGEGTYDVLQDWIDPDGDPILLTGAELRTPSPNDNVVHAPSGRLDFNDGGVQAGLKPVEVTVSDAHTVPASATGVLRVTVRGENQEFPPVARPDFLSTSVGSTVTIRPLLNDSAGSGGELRLTAVRADGLDGATASHNRHDDSISFHAEESGDYRFTYQIADGGSQEVEGAIRVAVVDADGNTAPAAAPDLVVVPLGGTETVDVLANDHDRDGDVLAVQTLDAPDDPGLRASLIEFRRVRVELTRALSAPVVLSYRLSDGVNPSVEGQVVVVQAPEGRGNEAPRPVDDAVTVITGDVTSIPVLANDVDPDGDTLRLTPELVDPPAGDALAVVSGDVVKFRAPGASGTVQFSYEVRDPSGRAATARVLVDVREPSSDNLAPRGATLEARVLQGGVAKVTVPLVGVDPDGDSVVVDGLEDAPSMGLVTTPTASDHLEYRAFSDAEGGTDVFRYRLRDRRGAIGYGTVRVAVIPRTEPNRPPEAFDDTIEVRPGGTVLVPVLANDIDPDGDRIELAADRPPEAHGGLEAEVSGTRLRITAPGDGPYPGVRYQVTDGKGGYGAAWVDVRVTPDAEPLPPVARDDVDTRAVGADEHSRSVSVTDNDEDPDGDPARLQVSLVDPAPEWASSVDNDERDEVRVRLGDTPRVVAYRVTDVDGLSAVGFVRVPARGAAVNQPPRQVGSDRLPIEVEPGGRIEIDVTDFVADDDGPDELRLTDVARVSATRARNDGSLVVDPTTLAYEPRAGFDRGEASITFEVTDGDATLVVSLPIKVKAAGNQPPEASGQPVEVEVEPGEDLARVVLSGYFEDPDGDELTFSDLSGAPGGINARLVDGDVLEVSAAADATPDPSGAELGFTVGDGTHEVDGVATVRVVPSRRELARTGDDAVTVDVGDSVSVPVLANDVNPFDDGELTITGIDPGGFGGARLDGDQISVSPGPGSEGTWRVLYTVQDKLQDPQREVQGVLTVEVRDVPEQPSPPPKVDEVASKRVVLSWEQPDPRGSDISHYTVRWDGGGSSQRCTSTTCAITGLSNNTTYTFTVTATNEVGDSEPSAPSAPAKPDQRPDRPEPPTLEFLPETDGVLAMSWDRVEPDGSPVEEYRLRLTPAPPSGSSERSVGTNLEYEWTGLENGTQYTVELLARNEAGESEWSRPSSPEVPSRIADVPARPVATRVENVLGGQMRVRWEPLVRPADGGAEISSYTLRTYRAGSASPDPAVAPIPIGSGADALVRNIDRYVDYEFTVTATNRSGTTAESPRSEAQRPYGAPEVVTGVTATNGNGSATLTIPAPADGGRPIERYEVRTHLQSNNSVVKTDVFSAAAAKTVGGLANGTRYVFTVRACNEVGTATTGNGCQPTWSAPSNVARPLAPLGNPSISHSGSTNITFSWRLPADPGRAVASVEIRISDGTVIRPSLGWGGTGSRSVNFGYERPFSATITVRDEDGRTTSDSTNGTTAAYPRGGTASWGSHATVTGCATSSCRRMNLSVSGWPPNAGLALTCEYNPGGGWRTDFGYNPPDLTTNGSGAASTGDGNHNCVGSPGGWAYRFRVQQGSQVRYFQLP